MNTAPIPIPDMLDAVVQEWRGKLASEPTMPDIRAEEDLRGYLWQRFGTRLPNTCVCQGHVSPWSVFCEAYFAKHHVIVLKGSRGFAGKTWMLALLALVEATTLRATVSILGGSGGQSRRVQRAMDRFWSHPNAPLHLVDGEPGVMRTKFRGGHDIEALTASQTSVRGVHGQRLRIDEADEMDLRIFDAASGQTMSSDGVAAQTLIVSTHQHPDGTFSEILKRAADRQWAVREFCYRETLEPHGWLKVEEVQRKRSEMTDAMWRTEVELQEPSSEGRAIDQDAVEHMFSRPLGETEGEAGKDEEFEEPAKSGSYATGADWGKSAHFCVDDQTEMLTHRGWVSHDEIKCSDLAYSLNPNTGFGEWSPIDSVARFDYDGLLTRLCSRGHDSLSTMNHRWCVNDGQRWLWRTTETIARRHRIPIAAPLDATYAQAESIYSDSFVELVAWWWTEGSCGTGRSCGTIGQREPKADCIRGALTNLYGASGPLLRGAGRHLEQCEVAAIVQSTGSISSAARRFDRDRETVRRIRRNDRITQWNETVRSDGLILFRVSAQVTKELKRVCPSKIPSASFLLSLTPRQSMLFIDRSIDGDGWRRGTRRYWSQSSAARVSVFQMVCALNGIATSARVARVYPNGPHYAVALRRWKFVLASEFKSASEHYRGVVWCPVLARNQIWMARRNGQTFFTGNSAIATLRTDVRPKRFVALYRDRKKPYHVMVPTLAKRLTRYGGVACHDAHGIGAVIDELLTVDVEAYTQWQGAARIALFSEYISAVEKGDILAPLSEPWYRAHRYVTNDDLYGKGHPPDEFIGCALAYRASRAGRAPHDYGLTI